MTIKLQIFIALFFSASCFAEMSRINDSELSEVTGQSGVYLTGEISINENGGPIDGASGNSYFGDCSDSNKVCGARLSFQTQQNGGWFAIDNIKGSIAFPHHPIGEDKNHQKQHFLLGNLGFWVVMAHFLERVWWKLVCRKVFV